MPSLTKAIAPSGASKRKPAVRRVPTKTSINLATVGIKKTRWWLVILVLILILAAAAAIGKFLVYDRLAKVSAAQAEASKAHQELEETYQRIEAYGELNDIFAHYTYSGMSNEELGRVDRVAVMDMLQRIVVPRANIGSWEIKGNTLTMNLTGRNLQAINQLTQMLLDEDIVSYCEVNTAATDSKQWDAASSEVAANVVVYLTKPEEVAQK